MQINLFFAQALQEGFHRNNLCFNSFPIHQRSNVEDEQVPCYNSLPLGTQSEENMSLNTYKSSTQRSRSRGLDSIQATVQFCIHPKKNSYKKFNTFSSMTFQNFVMSPTNQTVIQACRQSLKRDTLIFNTIYIHGNHGVGKTHLLKAIQHELNISDTSRKAIFRTTESFTKHFTLSNKTNELQKFRDFYRQADILLIDDVHDLSHRDKTMSEFLHTFDALHEQGALVILVSNTHPNHLKGFSESLLNRFQGSLCLEMNAPCPKSTEEIIRLKAQGHKLNLNTAIVKRIAKHLQSNIRPLENIIKKIAAYQSLTQQSINQNILPGLFEPENTSAEHMETIITKVAQYFKICDKELRSTSKKRHLTQPRYLAISLAHHWGASLDQLGLHFGNRSINSINIALKVCQKLLKEDKAFAQLYTQMQSL